MKLSADADDRKSGSASLPPAPTPLPSHFKTQRDQELIRLALHRSPFFTCLDAEQVERVVRAATLLTFQPGEIVILEGCVDRDEEEERIRTEQQNESRKVELDVEGVADPDEYLDELYETDDGKLFLVGKEDVSSPGICETKEEHLSVRIKDDATMNENQKDVLENEKESRSSSLSDPPPPDSGVPPAIYIIRNGNADVWYQHVNPASLGPGMLFGEGGFLFGRQHSASVVASQSNRTLPLEVFVLDRQTFLQHVLPSDNMRHIFQQYATHVDEYGEAYMSLEDFVRACEPQQTQSTRDDPDRQDPKQQNPLLGTRLANTYHILRGSGNTTSPKSHHRISLTDFCFFQLLMARPDPEVDIAFLLLDVRKRGQIFLSDIQRFVPHHVDFKTEFFQRYFGLDEKQSIRPTHFSQFLVELQRELGAQAFFRAIREHGTPEGFLLPADFVRVLKTACGWRLPAGVSERLESLYCHGPIQAGENTARLSLQAGSLKNASLDSVRSSTENSVLGDMAWREQRLGERAFGFVDFVAFSEVLGNLPGICHLIDRAQRAKKGDPISPDDFKVANRVWGGQWSRRQVDVVFSLFDLDRDGYVSHEDTVSVCGLQVAQRLEAVPGRTGKLTFAPPPEFRPVPGPESSDALSDIDGSDGWDKGTMSGRIGSWMQHWSLTAMAGSLGVVLLYPADLIKTRLMNQRVMLHGSTTRRLYPSVLACAQHSIRQEGFLGLYRGLLPPLVGVAPEKAIKLYVNDLLRQAFVTHDDESGKPELSLPFEVLAGACAGACQLLVTNPMEISKIRLQLQGETASLLRAKGLTPPNPQTFTSILHDLGFPGVYRGASACLLRDIPFSAIYFPIYSFLKEAMVARNDSGQATPIDLLLAGTVAGVPAAWLTTPADVIKTRIQSIPRPGEGSYAGIRDCATKLYHDEGLPALFRGASMRVLRLAPQFGISLLAYEQLAKLVGLHKLPAPPTNAFVDPYDYRTAFPARALGPKQDDIDGWLQSFGQDSDSNDDSR